MLRSIFCSQFKLKLSAPCTASEIHELTLDVIDWYKLALDVSRWWLTASVDHNLKYIICMI